MTTAGRGEKFLFLAFFVALLLSFSGVEAASPGPTPPILWHNQATGDVVVWDMNGTSLNAQSSIATISPIWKIVGTGDFNHDSKSDILWQNSSSGDLYLWYMDGTSIIGGQAAGGVPDPKWEIIGVADFNDDGSPDYLWQHQTLGALYIWYTGFDDFWQTIIITGGASGGSVGNSLWKMAGVDDFSGDGNPDYLWRNTVNGEVRVWYLNNTTVTGSDTIAFVPDANWQIVGSGDFNRDSSNDILWQNHATGDLVVWFMDGISIAGQSSLNPSVVPDTNWKIANCWKIPQYTISAQNRVWNYATSALSIDLDSSDSYTLTASGLASLGGGFTTSKVFYAAHVADGSGNIDNYFGEIASGNSVILSNADRVYLFFLDEAVPGDNDNSGFIDVTVLNNDTSAVNVVSVSPLNHVVNYPEHGLKVYLDSAASYILSALGEASLGGGFTTSKVFYAAKPAGGAGNIDDHFGSITSGSSALVGNADYVHLFFLDEAFAGSNDNSGSMNVTIRDTPVSTVTSVPVSSQNNVSDYSNSALSVNLSSSASYTISASGLATLGPGYETEKVFYVAEVADGAGNADAYFGELHSGAETIISNASSISFFFLDEGTPGTNDNSGKINVTIKNNATNSSTLVQVSALNNVVRYVSHGVLMPLDSLGSYLATADGVASLGGGITTSKVFYVANFTSPSGNVDAQLGVLTSGSSVIITKADYVYFFFLDEATAGSNDNSGTITVTVAGG